MFGGVQAPCTSKSLPQRDAQAGRTDVKGTMAPSAAWVCVLVRRGRERMARRKGVVCIFENMFAGDKCFVEKKEDQN
jgi:hypothetical protein